MITPQDVVDAMPFIISLAWGLGAVFGWAIGLRCQEMDI